MMFFAVLVMLLAGCASNEVRILDRCMTLGAGEKISVVMSGNENQRIDCEKKREEPNSEKVHVIMSENENQRIDYQKQREEPKSESIYSDINDRIEHAISVMRIDPSACKGLSGCGAGSAKLRAD